MILGSTLGIGCSPPSAPSSLPTPPATASKESQYGAGSSQTEKEQIEVGLAELPPDDRAAVIKQQVCPVSGKKLGTMGPPLNIEFQNRSVWICCSACKEELIANFDTFLEKLNSEAKE
jgi:hypothetical protein